MSAEKRGSVRIKKTIGARFYHILKDGQKKWDMAMIRDMSETGMSIVTNEEFLHNDVITFLIKIPSRPLDSIEVAGRVVASEGAKDNFGNPLSESRITRIEFINLMQGQQEIIREYISWVLSKEKGG